QYLQLSQSQYIKTKLSRFNMQDSKPVKTPMQNSLKLKKLTPEEPRCNQKQYQQAIGSLMYAMIGSRPDIAYAISSLSQYSCDPSESHWKAVKHVFRYLNGTSNYAIHYQRIADLNVTGYTDSDWAGNADDRKSVSAYVFTIAGGAVAWSSKKQ